MLHHLKYHDKSYWAILMGEVDSAFFSITVTGITGFRTGILITLFVVLTSLYPFVIGSWTTGFKTDILISLFVIDSWTTGFRTGILISPFGFTLQFSFSKVSGAFLPLTCSNKLFIRATPHLRSIVKFRRPCEMSLGLWVNFRHLKRQSPITLNTESWNLTTQNLSIGHLKSEPLSFENINSNTGRMGQQKNKKISSTDSIGMKSLLIDFNAPKIVDDHLDISENTPDSIKEKDLSVKRLSQTEESWNRLFHRLKSSGAGCTVRRTPEKLMMNHGKPNYIIQK